jgi:hypothetical protein
MKEQIEDEHIAAIEVVHDYLLEKVGIPFKDPILYHLRMAYTRMYNELDMQQNDESN